MIRIKERKDSSVIWRQTLETCDSSISITCCYHWSYADALFRTSTYCRQWRIAQLYCSIKRSRQYISLAPMNRPNTIRVTGLYFLTSLANRTTAHFILFIFPHLRTELFQDLEQRRQVTQIELRNPKRRMKIYVLVVRLSYNWSQTTFFSKPLK